MQIESCQGHIMVVDGVFDDALCKDILDKFRDDPRKTDPFSNKMNAKPYREGKCLTISRHQDWKEIDGRVFDRLTQALKLYVDRFPIQTEISDTGYTVAEFLPGQKTNEHVDSIHGASVFRLITVVAYLNDVAEGGETVFPEQGQLVKPKRGRVVLFPPYFTHPHGANAPVGETRYILVTWAHSNPTWYKPGDPI